MDNSSERTIQAQKITWLGIWMNLALILLKTVAGFVGNSTAILADAVHSFSDFITDFALLWGVKAASRPKDDCHNYGHGKIEALVAVGMGAGLFLVALRILSEGMGKIWHFWQGDPLARPGMFALIAAIVSAIGKEWLSQKTLRVGRETGNQAVIANAWEHRSDAFSSAGVVLGIGAAMILGQKGLIFDPLAAILVSVLICRTAWQICFHSGNELIDASVDEETRRQILDIIRTVPGVNIPHNLRTRWVGKNVAIETHIKVDPALKISAAHDIATEVEKKLRQHFGSGTFISVHIEPLK